MFELGSESKEHQQIVDSLLNEKRTMFLYWYRFTQVRLVVHNFSFMNHLIPLLI
jgi:hypothetical protein